MKAELQEKEVLAMYDVRGIQNYIFKSNVAKEIIGASALVEKIVTGGLQKYIEGLDAEVQKNYMIDWENDDDQAFLKNQDVMMQVMFVGGGNAYVLFRKGSECQKVNQFLGKYILDATYSLNLSIAVIEKTDSYNADYNKINPRCCRPSGRTRIPGCGGPCGTTPRWCGALPAASCPGTTEI